MSVGVDVDVEVAVDVALNRGRRRSPPLFVPNCAANGFPGSNSPVLKDDAVSVVARCVECLFVVDHVQKLLQESSKRGGMDGRVQRETASMRTATAGKGGRKSQRGQSGITRLQPIGKRQ